MDNSQTTISQAEIIDRALNLPRVLRTALAEQLLWSLEQQADPEIDPKLIEEADQLARQVRAGQVRTVPWEQVKRELRESPKP